MATSEEWEEIWEGAFASVRRLFAKNAPPEEDDELATVTELRPEDEPEDADE
jgi:hypothetical protein